MLNRIFFVCLCLSVSSGVSSLSCRWLDHKFREYNENSLDMLSIMVNNSTNSNTTEDTVAFPNDLYRQALNASAEDKMAFTVQVLNETAALFEEDYSAASWDENTVDNFVNVITQQADSLRSCILSHSHQKNKRLHRYFNRLANHVLKKMDYSAEAWELIRKEIKTHLMRADQLLSSLINTN